MFPFFDEIGDYPVDYDSLYLSMNGSLYFGASPGNLQPQASVSLLTQGLPRIAPAWYGVDLSESGQVYVDLTSTQAIITWSNVASFTPLSGTVPASNLATFQVTLDQDGTVIFAYQALNSLDKATTGVDNSLVGSQQAILGITGGAGATDPGSQDLSADATKSGYSYTASNNTIYQAVSAQPPDGSNLAGLDLIFTPQIENQTFSGWTVTSEYNPDGSTSDSTTPEPATVVEISIAAFALTALWYRTAGAGKRRSGEIR